MTHREFVYDVAFSFVAEDEELANAIANALRDRFKCFVYSEAQDVIAGTDGVDTFSRVFAQEARIVVILFRDTWGETKWTRIEQTAIRNRAFDSGFEFTLFVNVDGAAVTLPPWVPKTQIYYGLQRFGVIGAAGVIEAKIEAHGGLPTIESAVDMAQRLRQEQEEADDRAGFLRSERGVKTASAQFKELCDAVARVGEQVGKQNPSRAVRIVKADTRSMIAYSSGYSLTLGWSCPYSNVLDDSGLYVRVLRGAAGNYGSSKLRLVNETELEFDVASGRMGWRKRHGDGRLYSPSDLADEVLKDFLAAIHSNAEGRALTDDDW